MQRVEFVVSGGEIVSTTADIVYRNRVLNMLLQHSLAADPTKPIVLKDDRNTVEALLSHLAGEQVDLGNRGLTCLITVFRCAHQYQCYNLGSHILRELERYHSPENVLHIYAVVQTLPELPEMGGDPSAPSAPPETDLSDVDPEQAYFAELLKRTFNRCMQVIDSRSGEVLSSDALLSLSLCQLQELAQRDSLQARELDIGRGVLRWLRYHSLSSHLSHEQQRLVIFSSLRLLTMSPKELKKLELEREGVLSREELEAVLQYLHHGGEAALPAQLEPYEPYWLCRRDGGKGSRGILQRLMERTRGGGYGGQDVVDSAERREATMQKRSRRVDKVKMALAVGASFIFD